MLLHFSSFFLVVDGSKLGIDPYFRTPPLPDFDCMPVAVGGAWAWVGGGYVHTRSKQKKTRTERVSRPAALGFLRGFLKRNAIKIIGFFQKNFWQKIRNSNYA